MLTERQYFKAKDVEVEVGNVSIKELEVKIDGKVLEGVIGVYLSLTPEGITLAVDLAVKTNDTLKE